MEDPKAEEVQKARVRVAMKDPKHLRKWLEESGRRWLVLDAMELVDSLPFPDGVRVLMQVLDCYRDHRRAISSGRTEMIENPLDGEDIEVEVMKDETLEVFEYDRAIRYLVGEVTRKDPTWRLENPAL